MRRSYFFNSLVAAVVLGLSVMAASAQTGQLRGHVTLKQDDGTIVKGVDAVIDVYRTDMAGTYHTKTDKKGEFVFAGLPFIGTYIVTASMPKASPYAVKGVKVGRDVDYEVALLPGDGHRFSEAEAKSAVAGGGGTGPATATGESAADKAKREELLKKNAEIEANNKKAQDTNKIVGESFTAGNAARASKNYDEALKQYDIGLAADPEQAALLTNKADVLKSRGVEKYNNAIKSSDEAAKTSGIEAAKSDFKSSAEAAGKAVELIKKETPATDPNEQKRQTVNKYIAMSVRAEAMRLFVTKADPSQADAGITAFEEYMAVETDPVKKMTARFDLAKMLLESGSGDKAFSQYQKILAEKPDDPDANLGAGLSLYSMGDKAKYQEAANFLQHFVDKAPDNHKDKESIKAVLAELKNTENVVPEKTPPRRKRP